jgi:hypothetical protein
VRIDRRMFFGLAATVPFARALGQTSAAPLIRDRIGVCFQPDTTGPLQQIDKADAAMRYMGLQSIRIRAPKVGADSWRRIYLPLGKKGYRFVFTHAFGRDPAEEVADLVQFAQAFPGQIIGYEGPNEPDLNPVTFNGMTDKRLGARTGDAPAAIALQQAMFRQLRERFTAKQVKMIAFNDWMQAQQRDCANFANTHIYPGAGKTLTDSAAAITRTARALGKGDIVITEFGYTDKPGRVFSDVTPKQAAKNIGKDIGFVMSRNDIARAFIYTIVDHYSQTDEFSNFGLFESDWTPKPSAAAIRGCTGGL